jgi:signal transduction histidine kinase
MEKLRSSLLAKLVAGVLLSVFLFMTLVSGVMAFLIYYECGYIPKTKAETEENIIENIADEYYVELIRDYYRAVMEDSSASILRYKNMFEQENCNVSFTAEGLDMDGNPDSNMPTLSNYELSDSRGHIIDETVLDYDYGYNELKISMPVDSIYLNLAQENSTDLIIYTDDKVKIYTYGSKTSTSDENSEVTETTDKTVGNENAASQSYVAVNVYDGGTTGVEVYDDGAADYSYSYSWDEGEMYEDLENPEWLENLEGWDIEVFGNGDYTATGRNSIIYEYEPNIYVTDETENFGVYIADLEPYYFKDNSSQKKQLDKVLDDIVDEYDCYYYDTWYDYSSELIYVSLSYNKEAVIQIDMKVAKELTANDELNNSWQLWLVDTFYGCGVPMFFVSFLMAVIMTIFLCVSAGHRRDSDEIKLSHFDKIPFDILLVVPVVLAVVFCVLLSDCYYYYIHFVETLIGSAVIAAVLIILFPIYVNTIAARAKTETLLKNTVIWRVLKLIWRAVCFICKRLVDAVRYIIRNLGLMWKYILAFFLLSLFELIMYLFSWESTDFGVMFVLFVIIKLVLFSFMFKALVDMNQLKKAGVQLAGGNSEYKVDTDRMYWEFKGHGNELNCIGDGIQKAVEESLKSERMKTELITNVSHDIKTPLTSIINYVDLLEKEDIQGEKAKEYIEVLDRQSNRLKKLIEDLIEASKASTGNMIVTLETVDAGIMLGQAIGEFQDRLNARRLKVVENNRAEHTNVTADGKLLWRCLANVFSNLCKYSEENTRVYIDTENTADGRRLAITVKNISKDELNITGDELMERFVRGDSSRNTEGSGLGLSIAQSLMELMDGELKIVVDGDLFKVVLLLNVSES